MGGGCTHCMDYQTEDLRENPKSITNVIIAEKLDTWLSQETVKTCFVGMCVAYWPAVGADVLSAPGAGAQVPLLEPAARATFTHRVGPVTGHLHSLTTDYLLLQWRLQWYSSGDNGAGSRRAECTSEWGGGEGPLAKYRVLILLWSTWYGGGLQASRASTVHRCYRAPLLLRISLPDTVYITVYKYRLYIMNGTYFIDHKLILIGCNHLKKSSINPNTAKIWNQDNFKYK